MTWASSQAEVYAQRAVKISDERGGQLSQPSANPFHGDRADLLGLCLRDAWQPGLPCREQDLEWIDPRDV